jgi:hypothetical protein
MIPEAELIKRELVVRNMALTDEVRLTRKSLVRWIALSLGLISPNESRTIAIDVLDVLLKEFAHGKRPTTKEIYEKVSKEGFGFRENSILPFAEACKQGADPAGERAVFYLKGQGEAAGSNPEGLREGV